MDHDQKLYVQLQPDQESLLHILKVQHKFAGVGRQVKPEKIHLTIIHFGIIKDVLAILPETSLTKQEAFATYVTETQVVISQYKHSNFELYPKKLELFGEYKTTLVITYEPTKEIIIFHEKCLGILFKFLRQAGVVDPKSWMKRDRNFQHALSINPHITIVKNFTSIVNSIELEHIRLQLMQLLY